MSLTKADLINSIYNQCGFFKNTSTTLVESLIEIIKSTLESGEDVLISGFGKFCVKEKGKRKGGRNPKTGESAIINARRVVTFQCSGVLRDKINGKG